ncbi:MAG: hypothetical protein M1828_001664 [Chrysothrix sp. TS-e1954]|nr:MAG: hypothetical protein M1828_001664 [Chrysothrix sp. TS-e1954]
MADPFSIFTGAVNVADVCVRVGNYLRSVNRIAKRVDAEVESLENEVNKFKDAYIALGKLCDTAKDRQRSSLLTSPELQHVNDPSVTLWTRAASLVQEGKILVERLKDVLQEVVGTESQPRFQKIEDVRRAIKFKSKDDQYNSMRRRLTNLNLELTTMLTAINLTSNATFRDETYDSLEKLPGKISLELQKLGLQLKAQIDRLEKTDSDLEPSIASARAAVAFTSLNQHFYVQQPDTSIWTGRSTYLDELREALLETPSASPRTQKRFVIHGIAGAGKTQLCCKFAQDYRESFWGIFWIDASSMSNATESWKKIAKIGDRDTNAEAGRNWLSNLQNPWLLIIDSADNSEEFVRTQFPSGDRGYVLITTRNPRLEIAATVGSISLDKLEEGEANDLLRKATKHKPWDGSAKTSASSIAKHLGYLPLALIHAGRAIFHRLCNLHDYIPFFDRALDSLRSRNLSGPYEDQDEHSMGPFTTFDIIYSGIEAQAFREIRPDRVSKDAIDLVNIFAFLHNTDIRLELLVRAGTNLQGVAETSKTPDTKSSIDTAIAPMSLFERLRKFAFDIVVKMQHPTPVLPEMFRLLGFQRFEEARARCAIDRLVQMSLISESSEEGTYSMHALVHMWVRKRMSISAQALWCKAAANCVASSIKLPPLIDEQSDRDFYLRVLIHVDQVRSVKKEIDTQLQKNQKDANSLHSWLWFGRPIMSTVSDTFDSAKYSRVYLECARYQEAEEILRVVFDTATARLGREHGQVLRVQLILSTALWHLGRPLEAQEMQEDALRISQERLGATHSQTLIIMDALGETCWQRGKLREARALHQAAYDGLKDDPRFVRESLKALGHLGDIHYWYIEFEQAMEKHQAAYDGLVTAFGLADLDTIAVKDHLAMSCLFVGGMTQVKRANELITDVYERRRERFGREHVYTLWSSCNLARILAARGSLESNVEMIQKAKQVLCEGLEAAERNLGPDHIGTLMGRMHLANTFLLEQDYETAEHDLKEIAEKQRQLPSARDGTHRDRIATLEMLASCYELQGRYEAAMQICETVMREFDALGGHDHPFRLKLMRKRNELALRIDGTTTLDS